MPHVPRRSRNSTNARIHAVRAAVGLLSRLAPRFTAAVAERLFFTPPPPRRSRGERLLREAETVRVSVDGRPVLAWRWGRGPAVALLHGWGGRAANLSAFVAPLAARGLSVVAIDAPGHGRSGRGLSSAPQFAGALRAVSGAVGGFHGVVGHSLGAAAAALAIRDGERVARVVFLAAAADPPRWVDVFAAHLRLSGAVVEEMRRRSERRIGRSWRELYVPTLVAGLEAPLLVVHDRGDAAVAFGDAEAIAAASPRATLVETSGLGHNGVLRDPVTVERVVAFLTEGLVAACGCGRPATDDGRCASCLLERELFDPELRWATLGAA